MKKCLWGCTYPQVKTLKKQKTQVNMTVGIGWGWPVTCAATLTWPLMRRMQSLYVAANVSRFPASLC